MHTQININILMPLLDDVRNVFISENFLSGMAEPAKLSIWKDKEEFVCVYKDIHFLLESISVKNEKTPYTEMNSELIEYSREIATSMNNYSTVEFQNIVWQSISTIIKITDNHPKMKNFAEYIIKQGELYGYIKNDIDKKWLKRTIFFTVARQIEAIINMRAVTLSKRFIPLELILDAYRNGLYPFGWSFIENSVFTLDPCSTN